MKRTVVALMLGTALAFPEPANAYKIFVSNEGDNTITVIDSETMSVIETVQVGQRPRGITITNDGKYVLLCASDDDTVQMIDTATYEIVGTLPSGPDPELFVLHPSGNPLYIANEDDNLVTVVDVEDRSLVAEIPVGVEPEGMGISPDGAVMVNTSETTNMAHFIDTGTNTITHNVLVDSRPRFAEFKSDGTEVWVSAEIGGTVSVIDTATHEIKHKITFEIAGLRPEAIQPVGVRITSDNKTAFIALGPANRVAVVNAETYEVEDYLLVGQRVWQLGFSPDESLIFSTNGISNDMSVIDVAEREVINTIQTGRLPWGVVTTPE
jgi:PQQ-dependent catabolism-associated beta-propeller protein